MKSVPTDRTSCASWLMLPWLVMDCTDRPSVPPPVPPPEPEPRPPEPQRVPEPGRIPTPPLSPRGSTHRLVEPPCGVGVNRSGSEQSNASAAGTVTTCGAACWAGGRAWCARSPLLRSRSRLLAFMVDPSREPEDPPLACRGPRAEPTCEPPPVDPPPPILAESGRTQPDVFRRIRDGPL